MAEEDGWLFDPLEFPPVARNASGGVALAPLNHPLWTEHKAALILRYLRYFVYITKHGTYIDGFAGPQNELPGMWAWAALAEFADAMGPDFLDAANIDGRLDWFSE